MNGKILAMFLLATAVIGGAGMYYLQVYGFYEDVQATNVDDVQLTGLISDQPEAILYENFRGIDADSSPLRYRACFETSMSLPLLSETYQIYDNAVPTVAPDWFECFDANALGAELERGTAIAFLGTFNITYGFDRVVAITEDGQGYAWHQLNACGEKVFDGDPPPDGCPPPPDRD